MLPMKAVRLQLGELLGADATTLAPAANGNKVVLIAAPITLDENHVYADITAATFTGSTPLVCGTGAQPVGVDPATLEQVITLLAPAGGFRWECTVAPGAPEVIYGFALANNGLTTLLGITLLDTPITIVNVGDEVNAGALTMTILAAPVR